MIPWWLQAYIIYWSILLVIGIIALILWQFLKYKHRHSLRFQARKTLADIKKIKGFGSFLFRFGIPYTPEIKQIIVVGISAVILFVISRWIVLPFDIEARMWLQIYLFILTATIPAAAILNAHVVRKSEEAELARAVRALYQITGVRVIIVSQLIVLLTLTLFNFVIPSNWVATFTGLSTVWAALLSSYLFARTFKAVANPIIIQRVALNIWKKEPGLALEHELISRVSNALLRKNFKDQRVHFPFDYPRLENWPAIPAQVEGTILDIDPSKLMNLLDVINKETPFDPSEGPYKEGESIPAEIKTDSFPVPAPLLAFRCFIGDGISRHSRLVLIPPSVPIDKIENLIRKLYTIGESPSPKEEFEENLKGRKERFLKLLKDGLYEQSKVIAKEFVDIFDNLLYESQNYVITYPDLVDLPWQSLVGHFEHVLTKMIMDAIMVANDEAANVTLGMLFRLNSISLKEKDPSWLYVMLRQYLFVYQTAQESCAPDLLNRIVDRTWRHIQEMSRFTILPMLEREHLPQDMEQVLRVAQAPLIELNQLAKNAIDFSKEDHFAKFLETINSIEFYMRPDVDRHLRHVEPDDIPPYRRQLWRSRNTCLMGLGGWIIERYRDKKFDAELAKKMLNQIHIHISFDDLLDVGFHPIDRPSESRFGWDDWDWKREDREESPLKVYQTRFGEPRWVYDFFLFEMIKNGKQSDSWSMIEFAQPAQPGLQFRKKELEERIDQMHNETLFQKLTDLVPEDISESIVKIKIYLGHLEENVNQQDKLWIRAQNIDEGKIRLAKESFTKSFQENATLRRIIEERGKFVTRDTWEKEEKFILGFWDNRESYIVGSNVAGVDHFWADIARDFASDESCEILRRIRESAPIEDLGTKNANHTIEQVKEIIKQMREENLVPEVILMTGWVFEDWRSDQVLRQHPRYEQIPETNKRFPDQQGNLYDLPLVQMWSGKKTDETYMLILSLQSIHLKNAELGEGYKQLFKIEFDFMNEEKAREILKKNKSWLTDKKTGKNRTEEEAILEIQQHIWVKVYEQFEVEVENPRGVRGLKVKVREDESKKSPQLTP